MPYTKQQKSELNTLISEFFTDETLVASFAAQIADIVTRNIQGALEKLNNKINLIEGKIEEVQAENEDIKKRLDELEQSARSNQIRIYGIPEIINENLEETVKDIFESKLNITRCKLEKCYRTGKLQQNMNKPRSIIVKFENNNYKNEVYQAKKKLKGSKYVITEDLTKLRFELLLLAKEKLGKTNAWTDSGRVFIAYAGKRMALKTTEDLMNILDQ